MDDPIRVLRAPAAGEALTTSGFVLAEAIRVILGSNPHLQGPGIEAALERLELYPDPIPAQVAPYHPIMLEGGDFQDDLEWCLPDTWVNVMVPDVEGLTAWFAQHGIKSTSVGVERRFVDLIEDPGSCWPWDTSELGRLIDLLGFNTCAPETT